MSVKGNAATELEPGDVAGAPGVSQTHWNNLPEANGRSKDLRDHSGKQVPGMSAAWKVPEGDTAWRSKAGREWGFKDGNLKMQRGYIQLGGSLSVTDIPYAKYDVLVYLEADDNSGSGKVSISSPTGGVDPTGAYFYKLGWFGGKFVRAESTSAESAKTANYVVFSGNTAKAFTLDWTGDQGGWTGVSAVQIVETP